jgi:hypothetical protein
MPRIPPGGATLNMSELRQIPCNRFSQQRYVEISTFRRFALIFVQLLVNTSGQFGPIGVQSTLPAGRVAREQPILVAMWSKAVATLLFTLTCARALK